MDFKLLMDLRQYLTIAHHVPGRIRIKFAFRMLKDPRAKRLKDETEGKTPPPAILNTRVNPMGRSVVIEYDPELIDPGKLAEVMTTGDQERFKELAAEFEGILMSENHA